MIPVMAKGSDLHYREMMMGPVYAEVKRRLGANGTIIPLGDRRFGDVGGTTLTLTGDVQQTLTWQEAPDSWDTPFDPTDPSCWQGLVPVYKFNGTNEFGVIADDSYWSRDDSSGEGFSVGGWCKPDDLGSDRYWFTKAGEWRMMFESSKFRNRLVDGAAVPRCEIAFTTVDEWHFFVWTYDGTGGATSQTGANCYIDASSSGISRAEDGSYSAMSDGANGVVIGSQSASGGRVYSGKMAGGPLGPFFTTKELSADEIQALYNLGVSALGIAGI